MTDFDKEEFWKGLDGLHDDAVTFSREMAELDGKLSKHDLDLKELSAAVKQLAAVARSREGCLKRFEASPGRSHVASRRCKHKF
jgi:hypothetical protein